MSLFKRGNTWWVRFSTPDGQQVRQSAKTANKQLAQEASVLRVQAVTWQFMYLNLFLVPKTKTALQTVASIGSMKLAAFANWWSSLQLGDEAERKAVADALCGHELLTVLGDTLVVTPKGKAFLEFLRQAGQPF